MLAGDDLSGFCGLHDIQQRQTNIRAICYRNQKFFAALQAIQKAADAFIGKSLVVSKNRVGHNTVSRNHPCIICQFEHGVVRCINVDFSMLAADRALNVVDAGVAVRCDPAIFIYIIILL